MIKEIKALEKKYNKIAKNSEYVSVGEILNDFYHLKQDVRLKRVPKNQRWKIVNIGIISVGKLAGIWGFVIWPGIGVKIIKDGFQKRKIGKSVIGFWNFLFVIFILRVEIIKSRAVIIDSIQVNITFNIKQNLHYKEIVENNKIIRKILLV